MATLCIYCGSNFRGNPRFLEMAQLVRKILAKENHSLVYDGGKVGLMGVVAIHHLLHHKTRLVSKWMD